MRGKLSAAPAVASVSQRGRRVARPARPAPPTPAYPAGNALALRVRMPECDDERYHAYPNTILEFFPASAPPVRVDLRRRLDGATHAAIAQLGLGDAFAVFTAENPDGRNAEDEPTPAAEAARARENAQRQRALEDVLRETAVPWLRVDGVAPTGDYREHCVAVAIPRDDAAALAERLRQLALFWYDGARFWLLPAKADEEAVELPRE